MSRTYRILSYRTGTSPVCPMQRWVDPNNPNDEYHNIIVVDVAVEFRILLGREHTSDPSVVRTYF
jgi:hypothetical protein